MYEYLQRRRRTFVIADWIGACFITIGIARILYLHMVGGFLFAWKHGLWSLVPGVVSIAVIVWLMHRIRCPICRGRLWQRTPLRKRPAFRKQPVVPSSCPKCGADFSQPMPNKAA